LFIIPGSRRKAKKDLHERVASLRTNLVASLRNEFDKEIKESLTRIEEAIAPYSRFVRSEKAQTDQTLNDMKTAKIEIEQLRSQIDSWQ
jgi:hypothetical protein